jgi:hypothetical protein
MSYTRSTNTISNATQLVSSRIGALLTAGILVRLVLWAVFPPIWKTVSVFTSLSMPVFEYVGNFKGYYPLRMPFFDVLSAAFYVPLSGLLGIKALTLFSVVISCLSLPAFYGGVRRLLNRDIAFYGTVLFALYPKYVVLSVRGMPEAASVAFLVFALYAYARATDDTGREIRWYAVAGVAATTAFLMFVPAVFAAIVLSVVLYIDGVRDRDAIIPEWSFWAYSLTPGIVGVLYLVYGPLTTLISATTGDGWEYYSYSLFVDPTSYSIIEKTVRYVGYTYFDFWWHMRGFDLEANILARIGSYKSFLGSLFPAYALGWFLITLTLSVPILYGMYRLISDHELGEVRWTVLGWSVGYIILYNFKNLGWTGAFQTRQVFPVFVTLSIAFGVGLAAAPQIPLISVATRLSQHRGLTNLRQSIAAVDLRMVVITVGMAILLVNAGVQGVFTANNAETGVEKPVERLTAVHEPGQQVATVTLENYRDVLMYSHGSIEPILFANNGSMRDDFEFFTTQAEIQIRPPSELAGTDIDYLYIVQQCGEFTARQKSYISAAEEFGDTIVSERHTRGAKCDINIAIIKLQN